MTMSDSLKQRLPSIHSSFGSSP